MRAYQNKHIFHALPEVHLGHLPLQIKGERALSFPRAKNPGSKQNFHRLFAPFLALSPKPAIAFAPRGAP
jgi:hypothetical protein